MWSSACLQLCINCFNMIHVILSTIYTRVHCCVVIMSAMACQITGVTIVYSIVCSGTDQRKHQSSDSLAFVREIHRWPVNSPYKGAVTRKMFPFDGVIISALRLLMTRYLLPFCRQSMRVRCLANAISIAVILSKFCVISDRVVIGVACMPTETRRSQGISMQN